MRTTKLSNRGQVTIPNAFRTAHHWAPGLELMVIDAGDGILLKPKAAFAPTELSAVFGMFKHKAVAKTADKIEAALHEDVRSKWRGGNC